MKFEGSDSIREYCNSINKGNDFFLAGYANFNAGWVESGKALRFLISEAKKRNGITFVQGKVSSLIMNNNTATDKHMNNSLKSIRVVGVKLTNGTEIRGDLTIIAAGAWTPVLLPWMRNFITPVAQPVFWFEPDSSLDLKRFTPSNNFRVIAADLEKIGFYLFPLHPHAKCIKIGNHGTGIPLINQNITPQTLQDLQSAFFDQEEKLFRTFLADAFPELSNAKVKRFRFCLYSDTFDGDFWIDHDAEREGLVIAAGGSGHGFKFGPMIGEIIADVAEKKPNPYADKFKWRQKTDGNRKEASRAITQPIVFAKH